MSTAVLAVNQKPARKNYFRRAMGWSVLFHCLVLPLMVLFSSAFWPTPPETLLELDLVNEQFQAPPQQQPDSAQPASPVMPATAARPAAPAVSAPAVSPAVASTASSEQPAWQPPGEAVGGEAAPSSAPVGNVPAASSKPKTGIIIPPKILDRLEPSYPSDARSQGIEGSVSIKIGISESGSPSDCYVVRSSGNSSLDNAALAAVRRWRFVPARDQDSGASVSCYSTVTVVFDLK